MKLLEKIERNQSYDYVLADTDETGTYIQRINAYTDTDAWILSRFVDKYYVEDLDMSEYEDFVKETSVISRLEITDWYGMRGKAYDQYGEEMMEVIDFSVTGAATIEDGTLKINEVSEDASFTITAKVGGLTETYESMAYAKVEQEVPSDLQAEIEGLKRELDIIKGVTD